jgi:ATP-dependent Clp protease ATP-binding subunit ClpA
MTSNIGTNLKSSGIGFGAEAEERAEIKIRDMMKESFRPEFLNRVDEIVVFRSLKREELSKIVDLQLKEVHEEVREKKMFIEVSDDVKTMILNEGFDDKYGARPLRRTIQKLIEDEIAELYIRKKIVAGCTMKFILENKKVKVSIQSQQD